MAEAVELHPAERQRLSEGPGAVRQAANRHRLWRRTSEGMTLEEILKREPKS